MISLLYSVINKIFIYILPAPDIQPQPDNMKLKDNAHV